MLVMLVIRLLASLFAIVSAEAALFETLHHVPNDWYEVEMAPANKQIHFRIAMTEPSNGLLEQTLYDLSTPSHPNYGKHMKRDDIKAMLRPHSVATNSVLEWLYSSDISQSDVVDDGDFIHFVTTVSKAEKMLDTTFQVYRNKNKPVDIIRTLEYSLPGSLHQYVDMIQPTTRFPQIRAQRSDIVDIHLAAIDNDDTSCNSTTTPSCLKSLYNIETPSLNQSYGFIGINGFLEEYPRYDDFAAFEQTYATWLNNENFTWTSVNGGLLDQSSTEDSGEANLDVQYAISLGFPAPGNYYSTAGLGYLVPDLDQPTDDGNEPYLKLFDYLLSLPDGELPHTLTTSYGEDEQSVPASYAKTVCNQIAQLGLRGVSVIFSSGDTGVGSACQTNDGKNTTRFLPIFPAACPYVTSVGGTYRIEPEKAISFSSGGFSDLWARPSYQDTAVSSYLDILGDRWDGLYNKTGRGFPDVAAQAYNFRIFDKGSDSGVSGTSCSAPTFAGVIGLLNEVRLSSGQSSLGFLNPWLYSNGSQGLTDIVNGGSTGCTGIDSYSGLTTPFVPYASWNATTGWDPVTGLGTPDYGKLLALQ